MEPPSGKYVTSISVWKQKIEMYLCTFNYETTTTFCLNFRLVRSHIYLAKMCLFNHTTVHIFYIIHNKTLFTNRRNWNLLLHKEIEIGHIYLLNEWMINQSINMVCYLEDTQKKIIRVNKWLPFFRQNSIMCYNTTELISLSFLGELLAIWMPVVVNGS